ncbi:MULTISPECIES: hemagglutinin repeat-containing protein [unclassified Variovorax]|uniref:hemagglutinin repeat-containing protein n=1 Tax=unclassified Variovorax TaxID=663243 RepID=UPI0011605919|nr:MULTISPECIES: hemagglutinin repeat-containing protein [unclassified Variovorax]
MSVLCRYFCRYRAATVEANRVTANVGGDLNITTLQDVCDDEAAACWVANGACRAAGHAVIGSLSGGVEGAAGGVVSTQAAPLIDRAAMALVLTDAAHDAVVVGLTATVGGALGGTLGAAGAFNEVNNNFLTGKQVAQKQKELAECKSNCLAIQNKWGRLDIEQQTLLDDLQAQIFQNSMTGGAAYLEGKD